MGKDYLQRSIAKVLGREAQRCYTRHNVGSMDLCLSAQVFDIKEGLSGLGETIEEMRSVCRQLQSELKKLPGCSEASFEAEADALMDSWLDVSILKIKDLMLLVKAVLMFGVLAGDGEDGRLHGQPPGGAGAVGKAAESRGGGGQLGGGQTGLVC